MKITDLKPTNKSIVLGIFSEKTFQEFDNLGFCAYYDFYHWPPIIAKYSLIRQVENACIQADKIIFVLDGIYFPINTDYSIACKELELVCRNDQYFNKTIFVKGENVINFDRNIL